MRVLLISPVAGLDPPCGDITYTETLLAHPPAGVRYETYDQALARGALVERGRRDRLSREPLLTLAGKAVNVLRSRGVLFWEPFRFFDVRPGEYDLVHVHVFSAAFRRIDCPLVVSCGAPQRDLYLNHRRFRRVRVAAMGAVERVLCRVFGVNGSSYAMPQAERVMVYTEYFRDHLHEAGYVGRDRTDVIPIMHAADAGRAIEARTPRVVGFVANDFEAKGGPTLLEAFARVRERYSHATLHIVGSTPQMSESEQRRRGVVWTGRVPRDRLLREIMPSFDVFAYPTPHDCFSYVMLEAMACGCAIATSDYVSMPEAVDFGRAGLVSPVGDAAALAENVARLLEPEANAHFQSAARRRFDEHFSVAAVGPRMLASYRAAIRVFESRHADAATDPSAATCCEEAG